MQAFTALLVVSLAAAAYALPSGRIVGGSDAAEGQYPYQVALKRYNSLFCGGSVISKRYVLTAAHCLVGKSAAYVTVHAGTVLLDQDRYVYQAEKLIVHENYQPQIVRNDVALVRVNRDIEFNEFVQPIPLISHNNVKAGDAVVLTGWGRLGAYRPIPNNLQQINLRLESPQKCSNAFPVVTDSHVCTYTKAGEGACMGDSGGPLVANGAQVGIVSFGMPCGVGYPDVFTRVYSFVDWVKEHSQE